MFDVKRSWWSEEVPIVTAAYETDESTGLNPTQIKQRVKVYGKNEIPPPPTTSIFKLILDQFSDLLVLILLGAAVVSFLLALFEEGEDKLTAFVEPAVILTILILNAVVGVLQESKAEKAIEALKESEARDAVVIRDSQQYIVHSSELVPGDVIVVSVGDKVPADARLTHFYSPTLLVDEATLTGESEATQKHTNVVTVTNAVNQDKRNMLFSGTLVVRGKARAIVTTTAAATEIGAIAHDLSGDDEKTPLQEKLDEFGAQLSKIIALICVVVWLMNIGHFTDPDHGSAVRGAIYYFKIAVALAVAAIPEGLPAVVTTCLALGTMKMAKKNAIVRSLPSVETLGCTTVICSDKTGTLTTNQMSVTRVLAINSVAAAVGKVSFTEYDVEGDSFAPIGRLLHRDSNRNANAAAAVAVTAAEDASLLNIGKISALCNEATLAWKPATDTKAAAYVKTGAPTEAALLVLAEKIGTESSNSDSNSDDPITRAHAARQHWEHLYPRVHELEFDRDRKSMSVIVKDNSSNSNNNSWLYCKGAPESILDRCTHIRDSNNKKAVLTPAIRAAIQQHMDEYSAAGLRCLALAELLNPATAAAVDYGDMSRYSEYESKMTFVGVVAMLDPPRAAVAAAIATCRTAGIRVIVITGDNQQTAESICGRINVFTAAELSNPAAMSQLSFTGAQLDRMHTDSERRSAVRTAHFFSRVEPKHKLLIVSLLKEDGEVVAMTGDGVNDATALKKADIGIAMGSGTDVAREASQMVLQDDNFATIVMAVEEGRCIYANTKQFIRYLISSNIGEVACIFFTAMLGMPEALIPVQLLWVNLVTDGLPATALGFNPPDADIMTCAPRGRSERIINRWTFVRYMVIGVYVGIGTVGGFIWWYLYSTLGPQITFQQLTSFHSCAAEQAAAVAGSPSLFTGIDCAVFHDARPSTVSLSILVTIEMFNALNALSENQSLLTVTPLSNLYVVAACVLSFALHFMIIYTPQLAAIFHVLPLSQEEWLYVIYFSAPIFAVDEALKWVSRRTQTTESELQYRLMLKRNKNRQTATDIANSSNSSHHHDNEHHEQQLPLLSPSSSTAATTVASTLSSIAHIISMPVDNSSSGKDDENKQSWLGAQVQSFDAVKQRLTSTFITPIAVTATAAATRNSNNNNSNINSNDIELSNININSSASDGIEQRLRQQKKS